MINKQGLWFVSLFGLILVLGIYYVTIKDNDLMVSNIDTITATSEVVSTEESSVLVSLRVQSEEELLSEMESLQTVLLDESASLEEKNDAYESLQVLKEVKGKEESLENKIKDKFNVDCFVKIDNDSITVTVGSNEHNTTLANNIIRCIQEEYEQNMYIVVKFQI